MSSSVSKHEEHPTPSEGAASSRRGKIGVRVVGRPDSLEQRVYLPEILKGLGVTARHFFANLFSRKYTVTVEYPEQKVKYPPRNRGLHRLMHRENGEVRCVVCGLCVEACPCDAIRMDTGVHAPAVDFRGDSVLGKIDLLKRGELSTATQGGVGGDWRQRTR